MAQATADQLRRYVLDGSDEDLRRLLTLSESFAVQARRAFQRAGVGPGWTVIDCGCGPVGALALLAEMVGPAGRVVGVDFSEAAIERAGSVTAALGLRT
jgi:ubiquinone/menaquinone biosynthesis C-methylase UbiE